MKHLFGSLKWKRIGSSYVTPQEKLARTFRNEGTAVTSGASSLFLLAYVLRDALASRALACELPHRTESLLRRIRINPV